MRSALASLGSALLLFACAVQAANDFTLTSLYYEPNELCTPVEIQIQFVPSLTVNASDLVKLSLPRFTSGECKQTKGANIDYGKFFHSLTTFVDMRWNEGDWDYSSMPFANSSITMRVKEGQQLKAGTTYTFVIMKASGIKIYCGLAENWESLMIWTNASGSTSRNAPMPVEISEQIGDACENLKLCSEHGTCDHCKQMCECDEGFGAVNDSVTKGGYPIAINCAMRTCPLGPAYADVPYDMYASHQDTECSNNGLCDRAEGFCECFEGWEGDACQRRPCPNDCSGHGRCLTLEELANEKEALPLTHQDPAGANLYRYGTVSEMRNKSWDHATFSACVCDSSWGVGLDAGEKQHSEWFGPDCSLRHCPGGDDPGTETVDETDCGGKLAAGGRGTGSTGNLCHVDCSNRGKCDHSTGECTCFAGWTSSDCAFQAIYLGDEFEG